MALFEPENSNCWDLRIQVTWRKKVFRRILPSILEIRAAGNSERTFFLGVAQLSQAGVPPSCCVSVQFPMSVFSRLVFLASLSAHCLWPFPAALRGGLWGGLWGRRCTRRLVSRFATEGTPACRLLPLSHCQQFTLRAEQVPPRSGRRV